MSVESACQPANSVTPENAIGSKRLKLNWLAILFLSLVTVAVFYPASLNSFVNYDDQEYVTGNPEVQKGLSWEGVRWAFTSGHAANWHPITWLSHMADAQLFGLNPWGHHLTSILLHGLATALLLLALWELTRQWWPSLFAATIFALHPTRVESVAWVSERKDVLAAVFWMLTLYAYARWVCERSPSAKKVWWALSLVSFAIGLMSKPVLVTLPCVLLLIDFWPLRRFAGEKPWRLLFEKTPFFLLVALSCCVTLVVQRDAMPTLASITFNERLANSAISYCRYIGQFFWPHNLCIFYPRPEYWPLALVIGAASMLLTISSVAFFWRRKRPYLLMGWLWFLGTLVPMIGLVQVGEQAMADRYSYLPSIGLLLMCSWGLRELSDHLGIQKPATISAATLVVVVCVWLTSRQIRVWTDSVTLFEHAISVAGGEANTFGTLGGALFRRGDRERAAVYLEKAVQLDPNYGLWRVDYGVTLAYLNRMAEAEEQLQQGIKLGAKSAGTLIQLGSVKAALGKPLESTLELQEAVRLEPSNSRARVFLGDALTAEGRASEALDQYQEALRLQPTNTEVIFGLATALTSLGRKAEAVDMWHRGLSLQPGHVHSRNSLGVVLADLGRFEEAAACFRKALELDPSFSDAAYNLKLIEAKRNAAEALSPKKE